MAKKNPAEESAASELEREVDAMMDPRAPEPPSAPELPTEATDGVASSDSDKEKLLVIDKGDSTSDEKPVETPTSDAPTNAGLDNPETTAAIDDISRSDSDELLAAQDEATADTSQSPVKKPRRNKKMWRYILPIAVVIAIVAALAVPTSRYYIFNQFGLRGSVSLAVIDSGTNLPLKNAAVTIGGVYGTTGSDGKVLLNSVRLGQQVLMVKSPAFAAVDEGLTISLGHNQIGKISLKPIGTSYKFKLTDYFSGRPIIGGEVSSGISAEPSNTSGLAILTLGGVQPKSTKITFTASGYNPKTIPVPAATSKITAVSLVPAGKDYFVSSSGGVYSSNLDGSDHKLLLASVTTDGQSALAANSDGQLLALVSLSQSGTDKNSNRELTVVNAKTSRSQTLVTGSSIKLIGWLDGDTLVFVLGQTCSGGASCYQLVSYNYDNSVRQQLASADNFSSVLTIGNRIYYVTGTDYASSAKPEFVVINSDGTNKNILLQKNIYGVYRISYDKLDLAAAGQWYGYDASTDQVQQISAPEDPITYLYADSPDGSKSVWISTGGLSIYDISSQTNKPLTDATSAGYPLRWVGNGILIYRAGSADYAVSLAGGQSRKVANVVNIGGADAF